jgi:hypothetical protein
MSVQTIDESTAFVNTSDGVLMPPAPPIVEVSPGKFDYVKTKLEKEMLETAYKAISILELWNYVGQPCESFMFSHEKNVNLIHRKIEEIGYKGHSGFSFSWTMRQMQTISEIGEKQFMESYLSN